MTFRCLPRSEELAVLATAFTRSAKGFAYHRPPQPELLAIVAPSGIGKSRLMQEFYHLLTIDSVWDPASFNYWPDAFQTMAQQLHVTPDMRGHVPNGPARFLWLATRWHDPTYHNPLERDALEPLRDQLLMHAAICRNFESRWSKSLQNIVDQIAPKSVASDLTFEAVSTYLFEGVIPFSGILLEFFKPAIDPWTNKPTGNPREVEQRISDDLRTALLDAFRNVQGQKVKVPIILWLDDAHWMDAADRLFVRDLQTLAAAAHWPLLIVGTFWPEQWAALPADAAFRRGTVLELKPFPAEVFAPVVAEHFPGLSAENVERIVAKCHGNVLRLQERLNLLRSEPLYFVGQSVLKDLSAAGIRNIAQRWRD
jgi:hypothetical protein